MRAKSAKSMGNNGTVNEGMSICEGSRVFIDRKKCSGRTTRNVALRLVHVSESTRDPPQMGSVLAQADRIDVCTRLKNLHTQPVSSARTSTGTYYLNTDVIQPK